MKLDFSRSPALPRVGEVVRFFGPPPLTWWDRILWRLFRIERQRESSWREYVVTETSISDDGAIQ
jgi:hypothetical protein